MASINTRMVAAADNEQAGYDDTNPFDLFPCLAEIGVVGIKPVILHPPAQRPNRDDKRQSPKPIVPNKETNGRKRSPKNTGNVSAVLLI